MCQWRLLGSYQWQMLLPKWVLSEPHFRSVRQLLELGPFLHFLQREPVHLHLLGMLQRLLPHQRQLRALHYYFRRLLKLHHKWFRLYLVRRYKSLGTPQRILLLSSRLLLKRECGSLRSLHLFGP